MKAWILLDNIYFSISSIQLPMQPVTYCPNGRDFLVLNKVFQDVGVFFVLRGGVHMRGLAKIVCAEGGFNFRKLNF